MYHSLNFEMIPPKDGYHMTFNTYDDLFLVPTSRPVINPPSVKTKEIDIPGANGVLDLTESLTPYPVYGNRKGSIEFAVLNDKAPWTVIYNKIANLLHGRKAKMTLEDEPTWYYEGRWFFNNWASNNDGTWSNITLDYDLYPYKLETNLQGDKSKLDPNWLWDPFSFIDGVIAQSMTATGWDYGENYTTFFTRIPVDSSTWKAYGTLLRKSDGTTQDKIFTRDITGWMPVIPTITTYSDGMGIQIVNAELDTVYERVYESRGTYTDPQCVLYDWTGDGYTIYFKGTGDITLTFRRGSL